MHAYDRTYLAKLGFQDLDKKNPLHDQACQYLVQDEIVKQVFQGCCPKKQIKEFKARCEVPIGKGSAQFQTTIGFIDVLIRCTADGHYGLDLFNIGIEVKIYRESIGNCLRQINLYKSYTDDRVYQEYNGFTGWVLASPWSIDEDEEKVLQASQIYHVKLGKGFQDYCERKVATATSVEL